MYLLCTMFDQSLFVFFAGKLNSCLISSCGKWGDYNIWEFNIAFLSVPYIKRVSYDKLVLPCVTSQLLYQRDRVFTSVFTCHLWFHPRLRLWWLDLFHLLHRFTGYCTLYRCSEEHWNVKQLRRLILISAVLRRLNFISAAPLYKHIKFHLTLKR